MTEQQQPQPPAVPLPWARQPLSTEPPATTRARRQVQDLPDWEPLPPGEILVRRGNQP